MFIYITYHGSSIDYDYIDIVICTKYICINYYVKFLQSIYTCNRLLQVYDIHFTTVL